MSPTARSPGSTSGSWTIPDTWGETHLLDVAVAVIDAAGGVAKRFERLLFWPFTHGTLEGDLRAGLEPVASTYEEDVERYLVTARRGRTSPAG